MEKSALGGGSQGSEWDQERSARVTAWGVEVHQSALCSSVAGMVSQGVCLWAGKVSISAAATPEMLLRGAYTDSVAAAYSSSWVLQVPAVIPRFRES